MKNSVFVDLGSTDASLCLKVCRLYGLFSFNIALVVSIVEPGPGWAADDGSRETATVSGAVAMLHVCFAARYPCLCFFR